MVLASQMQEQEMGDGTNWVIIFAGALLEAAEDLIRMGLTPTDVAEGYQLALNKAIEILPTLKCWEVTDPKDLEMVCYIVSFIFVLSCGKGLNIFLHHFRTKTYRLKLFAPLPP